MRIALATLSLVAAIAASTGIAEPKVRRTDRGRWVLRGVAENKRHHFRPARDE